MGRPSRNLFKGATVATVSAAVLVPAAVVATDALVTTHTPRPAHRVAATSLLPPPPPTFHIPGYTWTRTLATSGVTVYAGRFTNLQATPTWTVTMLAPVVSLYTGRSANAELGTSPWADATAQQLRQAGYAPRVDALDWPDYTDTPDGVQGYRVRVGSYATHKKASAKATSIRAAGFAHVSVESTGFDSDQPSDAEQVHVAVVDPALTDRTVEATHGSAIARRFTTTRLASQTGSIVAVNGGFFVTTTSNGFPGAPAGIASYDGTLQALSVGDRAALVLDEAGRPSVHHLIATATLGVPGAAHRITGLNRKPGIVRLCGSQGLQPTTRPAQNLTCTRTDDMVLFTAKFGAALPQGPGAQILLGRRGRVVSAGARGGTIPQGGSAVQAIGSSATWLRTNATVGTQATVANHLRDNRTGVQLDLAHTNGIVSAAPTLLHNGVPAIDAVAEGVVDVRDRSYKFAFGEVRQPRTMAGIDGYGRLILVTVDGRWPRVSEGLTLSEGATLMRQLGALEALNLDGGGSTAMVVNGTLVTHPSDATGERADGDAIVIH
jgi:hypothetical protein